MACQILSLHHCRYGMYIYSRNFDNIWDFVHANKSTERCPPLIANSQSTWSLMCCYAPAIIIQFLKELMWLWHYTHLFHAVQYMESWILALTVTCSQTLSYSNYSRRIGLHFLAAHTWLLSCPLSPQEWLWLESYIPHTTSTVPVASPPQPELCQYIKALRIR
jgi:hypothetical protein